MAYVGSFTLFWEPHKSTSWASSSTDSTLTHRMQKVGRSAKIENLSKLFDFHSIWKPLMRGFQNGLIFQIWPRLKRELTYLKWHQKRIFEGLFAIFWEYTLITLSKITQNLKIRAYLKQNFMELDIKKIADLKTLTFGVWGLKTSLGQFGPKAFGRGLIKPLVKNPGSNFHKQDPIFSRIMGWIQ